MRVLLVNHRFPPDGVGGVECYTQHLATELVKAGETVHIVTRRPDKSVPRPRLVRERLADGAVLYRIVGGNIVYEHYGRFLLHHKEVEQCFNAVMVQAAPDVVHVNHLLGQSPQLMRVAHRLRVAVVASLHDFYFVCPRVHLQKPSGELCAGPEGGRECARSCFSREGAGATLRWGLRAAYFHRLLELADRVVCHSQYVASYFKGLGFQPTHIPLGIVNGVEDPVPAGWRTPKERGRLNLAFCGVLARHKGADVILEALREANLGAVDLVLFGKCNESSYEARLRQLAAAIPGLRLRLYGQYQGTDLHFLLRDVDCLIVPSRVPETGGLVAREALARGVPVLSSRLGALPEIVNDGANGFTFDPECPAELGRLLRRLQDDEGVLKRLRMGAFRTDVVTVTDHANAVRSVYREAMDNLTRNPAIRRADLAEIEFLYRALLALHNAEARDQVGCGHENQAFEHRREAATAKSIL